LEVFIKSKVAYHFCDTDKPCRIAAIDKDRRVLLESTH